MSRRFAPISAWLAFAGCSPSSTPDDAATPSVSAGHARAIVAEGGGFVARQPAAGTVARFTDRGVVVGGAPAAVDASPVALSFTSWGRVGAEQAAASLAPSLGGCAVADPKESANEAPCARRLEYAHPGVTAWWVGFDAGVEFGWTLAEPPAGSGAIGFTVAVTGGAVVGRGAGAEVVDARGGRWSVSAPVAWDAHQTPLLASLSVSGDRLVVTVDDAAATYPITVDPILTAPTTSLVGETAGDVFGGAIAGAGDVNGDGYDDVLVGASGYDGAGSAGRAYLYLGAADGLETTAAATITGGANELLGTSVAGAGDVNGDGYADVLIGSPGYTRGSASDTGRVQVFYGTSTGIASTADAQLYGSAASDRFGYAVSGAGDVNGDGYADVIVGAYSVDLSGLPDAGRAYVYHGSASGLKTTAATTLSGAVASGVFGRLVAGAGDVNADGYADVAVSAPYASFGTLDFAGRVYVYVGSSSGVSSTAAVSYRGMHADEFYGDTLASAGDVDGDGDDELVIGTRYYDDGSGTEAGRADVYYGSASGLSTTAGFELIGGTSDALGSSAAGAGDVDGDGYGDLVIGAFMASTGSDFGEVYVYSGGSSGLSTRDVVTLPGPSWPADFGLDAAAAGDVNGDGYRDVLVGSDAYSAVSACCFGRVDVYFGAGDADGDGVYVGGDPSTPQDCDDTDIFIGAAITRYVDADADGYGAGDAVTVCPDLDGYAETSTDCNDGNPDVRPTAKEVCDPWDTDENCDGWSDDLDANVVRSTMSEWYADADRDGFGDASIVKAACNQPSAYSSNAADCDDTRSDVSPGADEVCDPDDADEDCDGLADDGDRSLAASSRLTWYGDVDGDGYGDPEVVGSACNLPDGYVANADDCDDSRADFNPAAPEVCDPGDADEDCDGLANDGDTSLDTASATRWYTDADADGHGTVSTFRDACARPEGFATSDDDCDDARADVYPGATEVPGDDLDQNCDGGDAPSGAKGGCASTGGAGAGWAALAALGVVVGLRRKRSV